MRRLCLAIAFLSIVAGSASAQTLRLYHIDVEQADATLLVMPNGRTLLIDSGKNGMGRRLKPVMDAAGVNQIDAFVATHYHEDHYGGIDDLVDMGVSVLESYDRGDKECCVPQSKKNQATYKDYLRTVGEDARQLQRGHTIDLDPLVTIRVISSGGVVISEEPPTHGVDENDLSVSLLITFAGFDAFYGGDIEAPTEAKIAARDLVTDIDLYQANHHGSDTSSSQVFLEDLAPSVVIVSNGSNGSYHHPRQVILTRYANLASAPAVFQTNTCLLPAPCGNVADAFIADPQSTDEDGTILVTVDAAMNRYTVSYGTTTRMFQVKTAVPTGGVVIESVLPNPVGDDNQLEEVTLRNKGAAAAALAGWTLHDRSGLIWALDGSIAPGQSRTFRRDGRPMSLNNTGDEIVLLDAGRVAQDRFGYSSSTEGMRISTNH